MISPNGCVIPARGSTGAAGGAAQPGDEGGAVGRADAGHRVVALGGHLLGVGALLGVEDADGRAGPLLDGDRCWWLTAYFDKEEALFDAVMYVKAGRARQVPVAVGVPLRHRGTRLAFFTSPVPAETARRLGAGLLREAMSLRRRTSLASYDRLLPCQDLLRPAGSAT